MSVICRRHRVSKLDLFGSAASGAFREETSDLDFLVEFQPMSPSELVVHFFDLKRELESLFHRRVDLVEPRAIRNPYFREGIERARVAVYAA